MSATHFAKPFTLCLILILFSTRSSLAQPARNATAATAREEEIKDVRNYVIDHGPLQICIADWMPLVSCDPSKPSADYTGHDVEMFRLAAEKLSLKENQDWYYNCTSFGNFQPSLTTEGGTCDAAMCGISITRERQAMGYKYAYPYYATGLGMLVKSGLNESTGWAWLKPFDLSLWIALLLTFFLAPAYVFIIEFLTIKRRIYAKDIMPGVEEATWRAGWTLFGQETFHASSFPARFTIMFFAALCMIVSSTYTANLAAFLTVNQVTGTINNVEDLKGKAAHAADIYKQEMRTKYGIYTTYVNSEGLEGMARLSSLIQSGELMAGIEDEPTVTYIAYNVVEDCDLRVLPEIILPFDYAVAFRYNMTDDVVKAFSSAFIQMKENGEMVMLKQAYITGGATKCGDLSSSVTENTAEITFKDLFGLWVVFLTACLLGLLMMFAVRIYRWKKSKPYRDDPKKIDPEIGNGKYTSKSNGKRSSTNTSTDSTRTMTNGHHHAGDTLPTASYGNKSFITIVENQIKTSSLQQSKSSFPGATTTWNCGGTREMQKQVDKEIQKVTHNENAHAVIVSEEPEEYDNDHKDEDNPGQDMVEMFHDVDAGSSRL
jgi:ABC-type amino acid transport substrate-binding protein